MTVASRREAHCARRRGARARMRKGEVVQQPASGGTGGSGKAQKAAKAQKALKA